MEATHLKFTLITMTLIPISLELPVIFPHVTCQRAEAGPKTSQMCPVCWTSCQAFCEEADEATSISTATTTHLLQH